MILNFLYNGIMGLNGDLQKGIYVLDEFTQEITFHSQGLKPLSEEVRAAFDVITTGANAENMIGSDCFIVGVNHKFYASVKYALQEYETIMTEQMQSSGILNPTFESKVIEPTKNNLVDDIETSTEIIEMTVEEWTAKFKPIKNMFDDNAPFEGCMFETYGQELDFVRQQNNNYIWTDMEVEDGIEITNGYRLVNRLGYYVTEVPRDSDNFYLITEDFE